MPSAAQLRRRLPRLLFGLALFGVGIAMLVIADLGLAPWEVMHQGISERTGIPIGTVGILTGLCVLVLWIPLRERPGVGTIANVLLIGVVIDVTLWLAPASVDSVGIRWILLLGGTVIIAIGSGYYIGSGLGPGPRDGLMTGLGHRGVPIGLARAVIELSVLGIGWLLGGTVGIGTVIFAFGVGPLVGWILPLLSMDDLAEEPPVDGSESTTFWAE